VKKRLLKDTWFQMFAAVGGVAYVVSVLGTASTRQDLPAPAAPAAVSAPAPAPAAPVAAETEVITPPAAGSSDLATYNGTAAASRSPGALIMPPVTAPPPPSPVSNTPPKFTLTGTGVGNTQGIVGAPAGGLGTINALLNSLMGVPPAAQAPSAQTAAQAALPPLFRVAPSRAGIFTVGPAGLPGSDTSSLRDAVFSAANGDLILVKPGIYEGPVDVSNKSVRIRGTGANPGDVTVRWSGSGAAISVRNGTLDLEKIRVERGPFFEYPKTEPGGAVYAVASALTMRRTELTSNDPSAPALIVEQGDKPARVVADDSRFSGSSAIFLVRGPVKAKLTGVTFEGHNRPLAAWIDAVIELADCRFSDAGAETVIHAYEGARVSVMGKQKPRIVTARGAETTAFEESFGTKRVGIARGGFARDIFRRGRRAGTLP
jgi:hypothetical protein